MRRRESIQKMALSMGVIASGPSLAAFLSSCERNGSAFASLSILTEKQAITIDALTECILPKTPSAPGARELKLVSFIDHFLKEVSSVDSRSTIIEGLEHFMESLPDFSDEPFDQQNESISSWVQSSSANGAFFKELKQITLFSYFTSKMVVKNIMGYNPIPGTYDGCQPLDDDQNAWYL